MRIIVDRNPWTLLCEVWYGMGLPQQTVGSVNWDECDRMLNAATITFGGLVAEDGKGPSRGWEGIGKALDWLQEKNPAQHEHAAGSHSQKVSTHPVVAIVAEVWSCLSFWALPFFLPACLSQHIALHCIALQPQSKGCFV